MYYLAKSIDEALVRQHELPGEQLEKKRISENLRPRNVYQKALAVVEESNVLYQHAIDQTQLEAARRQDMNTATPRNVYNTLSLMKNVLEQRSSMFNDMLPETRSRRLFSLRAVHSRWNPGQTLMTMNLNAFKKNVRKKNFPFDKDRLFLYRLCLRNNLI